MTTQHQIGVGVIGLGFMGRTHIAAYRKAKTDGYSNRLIAVSDKDQSLKKGDTSARGNLDTGDSETLLFDPEKTSFHLDPAQLLALDEVDLVSICTHTTSHVDLAIQALEAGKHVLVEKPVALHSSDVQRLSDVARLSGRICMPAMCIRFWPGWDWLRKSIQSKTYGMVRSAVFRRLASHPGWSPEFYSDPGRSGGALFDLHIHDADFVRWCFGAPASVCSTGTIDHVTTAYRYLEGPPHVVAEGAWDHTPGFDFEMNFTVVFETATADFRLGREFALMLFREGGSESIELPELNGYDCEIRHLLKAITDGNTMLDATLEDAVQLTRMLEAERESLSTGSRVIL